MKLYHGYILRKVALVLVMSAVICSLALALIYLVRLGKDRTLGIPFLLMLRLMVYYNAFLAIYSVPISVLIACLLVFGRLAADNEFTALKASGIAPLRVFSSTLALGLALSFAMLWLNGWAAPHSHAAFMDLRFDAFSLDAFFRPGRTISVKNYSLDVGASEGGVLEEVIITVLSPEGRTTTILAEWGTLADRRSEGKVQLNLYNVEFFIEEAPSASEDGAAQEEPVESSGEPEAGAALVRETARAYQIVFDFGDIKSRAGGLADKDELTMRELLARRAVVGREGDAALAGAYAFEFNKRLVFALSPLVFAIVGVPLGVQVRRGERGLGTAIGVGIAAAYYSLILGIEKGITSRSAVPSVLVWVPCAAFAALGIWLMIRVNRGR